MSDTLVVPRFGGVTIVRSAEPASMSDTEPKLQRGCDPRWDDPTGYGRTNDLFFHAM